MRTCFYFLFMFFHSWCLAQNTLMEIKQKFYEYQSEWSSYRLQLFFNQEKYFPGDTIYFKAYFFTEDNKAVGGKQLIEVNLVDHRGQSVQTIRFHVTDGKGYNQLLLSEEVAPGLYLITAHSNWMRNFEPIPFFRKQIAIVKENRIESVSPDIDAAVEGGRLIAGVEQKVVISADKHGLPVTLVDDTGTPLLRDTTNHDGLGSFAFTPELNRSYFTHVEGVAGPLDLGRVYRDGCVLSLSPEEDNFGLRISAPPGSKLWGNEVFVVLTAFGKIQASKAVRLRQNEIATARFSRDSLSPGIIKASLIDASGNLLSTRDFFNEQAKRPVIVRLHTSKNKFGTREQIELEVTLTDSLGKPVRGDFCISVLNNATFDNEPRNSIAMHMQERMTRDEPVPDSFVILQTRELPWNQILADKLTYPGRALTRNIQLNGTAYADYDGAPLPDNTDVMFYLQHNKMNYQTFTIAGKVRLTMPDVFGSDEFFYIAETKNGKEISGITVRWDVDSLNFPTPLRAEEGNQEDRYAVFSKRRRLIEQSYSAVQIPSNTDNATTDFEDEIATADLTVNVSEYMTFPTMSEMIREVVPSLFHRRIGQKSIVRLSLNEPMTATGDPVYIIDGIASRNTDFFLSLLPSEIISIKLVKEPKKLARFGLLGKNGFVIVQTKKGNLREPLEDSARIYNGLSIPHNFSSVNPTDVLIHTPIFRSTVYWSPSIQVDASGKADIQFFSTDDVGSLQIRIDGYDAHGHRFSANEEIEIEVGNEKR